jgi:two-component sensor histidine kinase
MICEVILLRLIPYKIFTILGFILCFNQILLAQKSLIAVENNRPKAIADSIKNYQNLAEWFELTPQFNMDSILYYFDRSSQFARKQNSNYDLAIIYKKEADLYYRIQMLKECESFAYRAMNFYAKAKVNDSFLEFEIKYFLAISKLFNGDNKTALKLFLEAEKLVINNPRLEVQAQYFNNKSYFYLIYDIDGQDEENISYAKKSLKIYFKLNNPKYYNAIGRVFSRLSTYDVKKQSKLDLYFLSESEKYTLKSHDPYFPVFHILVREEVLYERKKYDEAHKILTEAIAHLTKYKLSKTNYYQYCMRYMGDLKRAEKQLDSAIFYYKKAYNLSNNVQYGKQALYNLRAISEVYQQKGDYKIALDYYQKFAEKKIKIENEKSARSLKEHDLEVDILAKQNDLQREQTNRNFLIGGIILLCGLAVFIFYNLRNQQKLNGLLSIRNNEKDILLKEIHHRVKNNLTVISSLLELQSFGIEDETIKATMLEGQSRVKSIALIHQKLYQNENLAQVDFRSFLDDLFKQISALFLKSGQKVNFKNNVSEILIDIDTAVPLGLISNELFTNSFKYAFSLEKVGQIVVNIKQIDNSTFQFIYQDNGNGLPEDMDFIKVKSMGLRLIQRLSKQLSGTASYQKIDGFSNFVIKFKNLKSRKLE